MVRPRAADPHDRTGGTRVTEVHDPCAENALRPLGEGSYAAELHPDWAVKGRPHGGYLLALLARSATAETRLDPLSVSAQFLRSPRVGPVLLRVTELKIGRTATVVRACLEQSGQTCVDATVTLGELPAGEPEWSERSSMPVNPPGNAVDLGASGSSALAGICEVRLDPEGAGFLSGSTGDPPRLRLWARPRNAQPDLLFALIAGDLSMPTVFNLGRLGWAPTVQLTALLRARPANGWLRLQVESKTVHGSWFDEDALVVDSTGRVVCQARQLALSSS